MTLLKTEIVGLLHESADAFSRDAKCTRIASARPSSRRPTNDFSRDAKCKRIASGRPFCVAEADNALNIFPKFVLSSKYAELTGLDNQPIFVCFLDANFGDFCSANW